MSELKNTVILGDCMDYMVKMRDNEFDLCICDPPYFKEYGKKIYPGSEISTTGVKRNRFESKHWEVPDQKFFDELIRISKNQIIWGINYYDIQNIGHGRIIWDKQNDDSSFSKAEIAYCSLHDSTQMFRYLWNGMLQQDMKNKEVRINPTQKPIALYKWLLKNYAKEGDTIFDSHAGSMSSVIASIEMGFSITASEIDKDYFNAGKNRVLNYFNQENIFRNNVDIQFIDTQ